MISALRVLGIAESSGTMNGIPTPKWLRGRRSSVERSSPAVQAELLQGIDVSKPILQSRVFKQFRSENGFNKRYFVLYPGVLVYYKHERDYRKDAKKGLSRCRVLKLNGLYLTKVEDPPANCKFCFNLHLPDSFNERSQMLLVVKSRKLKNLWMLYLQAQNPNLLPPSSSIKTKDSPQPGRKVTETSNSAVARLKENGTVVENGARKASMHRTTSV